MEWDESQEFPVHIFKELGKLGMMGVLVPEQYGGARRIYTNTVRHHPGNFQGLRIYRIISCCAQFTLYRAYSCFWEMKTKKKYLPKLATAGFIGAWGLTEANTGSDAGNMRTTAVKDGDNWVLNGTKNWITHGKSGDVAVVICRTGEPRAKNNSTAFIVDQYKRFQCRKKGKQTGYACSETAELIFDNCIIPDENRLGEVGSGFKQAMKILDGKS